MNENIFQCKSKNELPVKKDVEPEGRTVTEGHSRSTVWRARERAILRDSM